MPECIYHQAASGEKVSGTVFPTQENLTCRQQGGEDAHRLARAYCEYSGHSAEKATYQRDKDSSEPYPWLSCRRIYGGRDYGRTPRPQKRADRGVSGLCPRTFRI